MQKPKRCAAMLLAAVMLLTMLPATALAAVTPDTSWYSAGQSLYTIANEAALLGFAELLNGGNDFAGKTITLAADVAMTDTWQTPTGVFNGTFDGNNKTISNLNIAAVRATYPGYRNADIGGLIGRVKNATIRNVTVEISGYAFTGGSSGTRQFGGILAGAFPDDYYADSPETFSILVDNCHVRATQTISGILGNFGGIVGQIDGFSEDSDLLISDCSFTGDLVTGADTNYVGGIVGSVLCRTSGTKDPMSIQGCRVSGDISMGADSAYSNVMLGGIAANIQSKNFLIKDCYVSGDIGGLADGITTYAGNAGGIVGQITCSEYNSTTVGGINNSHFRGNVTAEYCAGGIAALADWMEDCSSAGGTVEIVVSTNTTAAAGGILGKGYYGDTGMVKNCYSTMDVKCMHSKATSSTPPSIGGLVGYGSGGSIEGNTDFQIVDSYATGSVTGYAHLGGLAGSVSSSAYSHAYGIKVTNCFATGAVTLPSDSSSNLYYVGGLIGEATSATIRDCYATGTVTVGGSGGATSGAFYAGGLVGFFSGTDYRAGGEHPTGKDATIDRCYYDGTIEIKRASEKPTASGTVGGLVGRTQYTPSRIPDMISNSMAKGKIITPVDGEEYPSFYADIRGFIGYGGRNLVNNIAAMDMSIWKNSTSISTSAFGFTNGSGATGTYQNCYFDKELAPDEDYVRDEPQSSMALGSILGKSTVALQTPDTYTDWKDFSSNWEPPVPESEVGKGDGSYPKPKIADLRGSITVSSFTAPETLFVAQGTDFARLILPGTVAAQTNKGADRYVVVWSQGNYNPAVAGDYTLTGTALFGAGSNNDANTGKQITMTVTVVPAIVRAEISGTPMVDAVLTAQGFSQNEGGEPMQGSMTYQWQASGTQGGSYTNVSGAVAATLTPAAADIGKYYRVSITFNGKTVQSQAVGPVAGAAFATAPAGLGGDEADCKVEGLTWTASAPIADSYTVYYLQSDTAITNPQDVVSRGLSVAGVITGTDITGLTNGKDYYIVVAASKTGYSDSLSAIYKRTPDAFPTTAGTSISIPKGPHYVGQLVDITCTTNAALVTYAWELTDGDSLEIISGANGATLRVKLLTPYLTSLKVTVTSTKDSGVSVVKNEVFTGSSALGAATFDDTDVRVGDTVTVTPVLADGAQSAISNPAYTYRWLLNNTSGSSSATEISGATEASYSPLPADGGKYLFVEITLTNNGGTESRIYEAGYIGEGIPQGSITLSVDDSPAARAEKLTLSFKADYTAPAAADYQGKTFYVYYAGHRAGATVESITQDNPGRPLTVTGADGVYEAIHKITTAGTGEGYDIVVGIKADYYDPLYSNIVTATVLKIAKSAIISGDSAVEALLTSNVKDSGGYDIAAANLQYQWQRSDAVDGTYTDIAGATSGTYRVQGDDYQKYVRLTATGDNITTYDATDDDDVGLAVSATKYIETEADFATRPVITKYVAGDRQVYLEWSASDPAATAYEVLVGGTPQSVDTDGNKATITGLVNGTEYNILVRAVKHGYANGTSTQVTVMPFLHATGVSVGLDKNSILLGGTATATAAVTPESAGPITYTWTAVPANAVTFASPDAGTTAITAVKPGQVTIRCTVTNRDGSQVIGEKTLTVTSNEANLLTFKVNGYIGVFNDTNVAITLPAGSALDALVPEFSLSVGAAAKVGDTAQVSGETANDFTGPVTYTVTAEDGTTTKSYTVTVTVGDKEALDVPDRESFAFDSKGAASWAPVQGAESYLVQLYCDGEPTGSAIRAGETEIDLLNAMRDNGPGSYSFAVTAIADPDTHINSAESGLGGSYTMLKIESINAAQNIRAEIGTPQADAGLPGSVSALLSDGSTVDIPVTWTGFDSEKLGEILLTGALGALPSNVVNIDSVLCPLLSVTIVPKTFTITASAGTGGGISPAGVTTVNQGDGVTYTITASGGYSILDVLVDGASVGAVGTYTFSDVQANRTIAATFQSTSVGPNPDPGPSDPGPSGGTTQQTIPAADGAVQVSFTASGGTAALTLPDSKVTEIISRAADSGEALFDLSGVKGITSATLPVSAVSALVEAQLDISLKLPGGTLVLDAEAAKSVSGQAAGAELGFELKTVASTALSAIQQSVLKDGDMVYDINILSGSAKITSFDGALVVSLPYSGPLPAGVWYLNDQGRLEQIPCTGENGIVSFTLSHLSYYVLGQDTNAPWENPFTDVTQSDWFYGDVEFAVVNGLFNGTSATTFSPRTAMTRGMLVTVLGRMAGVDEADYTGESFADVSESQYYAAYIKWAAQQGIVSGVGNNSFAPDAQITRQDLCVILYRYAQVMDITLPETAEAAAFADAEHIRDYAAEAVAAMQRAGIVNGKGSNTFDPLGSATRAEVAAMLHRFSAAVGD